MVRLSVKRGGGVFGFWPVSGRTWPRDPVHCVAGYRAGCSFARKQNTPGWRVRLLNEVCLSGPLAQILRFSPRPWPGGPQNAAPGTSWFFLEVSTTSALGWRAGWGTSLGTLRVSSKFSILISPLQWTNEVCHGSN